MNYRESKYYANLSILEATLVAELTQQPECPSEFYSAWQILIDTNLVWQYQGWYGRQAVRFIQDEVLQAGDEYAFWNRKSKTINHGGKKHEIN